MTTLIVYCYYETDETKSNLDFFLKTGVFDNQEYFYIFIINNSKCSLTFPKFSNIEVIYRTENNCDMMTYNWLIKDKPSEYFSNYSYYYFVNSSCIGPFMPTICINNWIESMNYFLLNHSMIGPIVEIPPDSNGYSYLNIQSTNNIPFIHTYMFGLTKSGFDIFKNILNKITDTSKMNMVCNIERVLTSSILLSGGKIKTLLSRFNKYDINQEKRWRTDIWNEPGKPSCYEVPGNYYGIDVNPFEIIFVKNIRNSSEVRASKNAGISDILRKQIENYRKWL